MLLKFQLLLIIFLLSNCSTVKPPQENLKQNKIEPDPEPISLFEVEDFGKDKDEATALDPIIFYSPLQNKVHRIKANHKLKSRVDFWINYYTHSLKDRFERFLNNGATYRPLVMDILKEHHLPEELYYLPVIESGYRLMARSYAGAVGPWQFIKSTGKDYGLVVNRYIDERNDIIKSTQAAVTFLRDLYNIFGSWELALAAYNAGPYRIMGSIIKGSNREFWRLSKQQILPTETSEYIPKFLAAIMIGENPSKYGLKVKRVERDKAYDKLITSIEIPSGISLRKISRLTKIDYKTLKQLNPELRRAYIPDWGTDYELNVPIQNKIMVEKNLTRIKRYAHSSSLKNHSLPGHSYYIVKGGDTLEAIARRYHVALKPLAQSNGIYNFSEIKIGQKLKITNDFSGIYKVKRGDTLGRIARFYNTRISYIKKINGLGNSKIYPGQRLRVSPHQGEFYIVKQGDTLSEIARSNNISIDGLIKLNALHSTKIYKGQTLVLNKM